MRMKTRLVSTNSMKSHTAVAATRVRADSTSCWRTPITSPQATAASTPDNPKASAAK